MTKYILLILFVVAVAAYFKNKKKVDRVVKNAAQDVKGQSDE